MILIVVCISFTEQMIFHLVKDEVDRKDLLRFV